MKHDFSGFLVDNNLPFARAPSVIGPCGELLTLDMLPVPGARWTPRRKAEIVAAVRGGMLAIEEACSIYNISVEEFDAWDRAIGRSGLRGLCVAELQAGRAGRAVRRINR